MDEDFGLGVETPLDYEQAVALTRITLRAHGFSILSEMPAPATIGGPTGRSHLFMGLWERLLSTGNLGGVGLDVGDHLPVNVVVFEQYSATIVAVLDPSEGLEGWGASQAATAQAAREAIEKVLEELGRGIV